MRRTASFVAAATVLVTALSVAPADAAFPGRNGRIAFYMDRGSGAEIYTMRPDGADVRRLTHLDVSVERPQSSCHRAPCSTRSSTRSSDPFCG